MLVYNLLSAHFIGLINLKNSVVHFPVPTFQNVFEVIGRLHAALAAAPIGASLTLHGRNWQELDISGHKSKSNTKRR